MVRINRYLAMVVLILAVVSVAIGGTFIYQAVDKESWIKEAMRLEKVTLGLPESAVKAGEVIDSAQEAQAAADTIREHRRGIAPTYEGLLGEGRYDTNDPVHLLYTQAINMENYLYMAVLAFGVLAAFKGIGAFMILVGIAFGAVGVLMLRLVKNVTGKLG